MNLKKDILKSGDPDKIAATLKHSDEISKGRNSSPY